MIDDLDFESFEFERDAAGNVIDPAYKHSLEAGEGDNLDAKVVQGHPIFDPKGTAPQNAAEAEVGLESKPAVKIANKTLATEMDMSVLDISVSFPPTRTVKSEKDSNDESNQVTKEEKGPVKDLLEEVFADYPDFLSYYEGGVSHLPTEEKIRPVVKVIAESLGEDVSVEKIAQLLDCDKLLSYLADANEKVRSEVMATFGFMSLRESAGKKKLAQYIVEPLPNYLPSGFKTEFDVAFRYLEQHVHRERPELARKEGLERAIKNLETDVVPPRESKRAFNAFMKSLSPKERLNYALDSAESSSITQQVITGISRSVLTGRMARSERTFSNKSSIALNNSLKNKTTVHVTSNEVLLTKEHFSDLILAMSEAGAKKVTLNEGMNKVAANLFFNTYTSLKEGGVELSFELDNKTPFELGQKAEKEKGATKGEEASPLKEKAMEASSKATNTEEKTSQAVAEQAAVEQESNEEEKDEEDASHTASQGLVRK